MKVAVILGTRPEIIKLSPVIRLLISENIEHVIIHTGQHYSYNMDEAFFKELNLPAPDINLNAGSGTQASQISKIMIGIEEYLKKNPVDVALVQGDTNTVMATALICSRMGVKVGHVEAGLRSYDREMPEEINRIIADHVSDFMFPPTENSKEIIAKEGISETNISVTGNTIVDAVYQNIEIAKQKSKILEELGLENKKFIVITSHRPANVDSKENLLKLFKVLEDVGKEYDYEMVYPMHPRTKKNIETLGLIIPGKVKVIEPVGYLDFLMLLSKSSVVLTDSGGIQEETCILKVPCITLRENTERPETITVGSNKLCGLDSKKVLEAMKYFEEKGNEWKNPFGDGTASNKILDFISSMVK